MWGTHCVMGQSIAYSDKQVSPKNGILFWLTNKITGWRKRGETILFLHVIQIWSEHQKAIKEMKDEVAVPVCEHHGQCCAVVTVLFKGHFVPDLTSWILTAYEASTWTKPKRMETPNQTRECWCNLDSRWVIKIKWDKKKLSQRQKHLCESSKQNATQRNNFDSAGCERSASWTTGPLLVFLNQNNKQPAPSAAFGRLWPNIWQKQHQGGGNCLNTQLWRAVSIVIQYQTFG